MTARRYDWDTVDLLYRVTATDQPPSYRPDDPGTWWVGTRLLTPAEVERVHRATRADWDVLGGMLAAARSLLEARVAALPEPVRSAMPPLV